MVKPYFFVSFFFLSYFVKAQQATLFHQDIYSGINSVATSPTHSLENPNPWDINLLSFQGFISNDYFSISKHRILDFATIRFVSIENQIYIKDKNTITPISENKESSKISYYGNIDIMGPSFSFQKKINEKLYSFGFFTRTRAMGAGLKIDNYFKFENDIKESPIQEVNPTLLYNNLAPAKTNAMHWNEIGINAVSPIFPNLDQQWSVGLSLKYLMGMDAYVVNSKSPILLTGIPASNSLEDSSIIASGYNIEANYATNYNFNDKTYNYQQRGKGLGLDVGLSVKNKREKSDSYDFLASFDVLDIGYVSFNGEHHIFQGDPIEVKNNPLFTELREPSQQLKAISSQVYRGDSLRSRQGDKFRVGLPTAVHFGFSQSLQENHYLGLGWMQRTPIFENSIKRANLLSLSYSMQKEIFAYGTSFTLYDYKKPQLGAYLRYGPFVIGSDHFLPLFVRQNKLESASFYFAIKVYPFWDNDFKRHRRASCDCEK